jgi:hypothetical protein
VKAKRTLDHGQKKVGEEFFSKKKLRLEETVNM